AAVHRRCLDGQSWEWDGVRFAILHPTEADYARAKKANDVSCVLKVSTATGAALLTGDIEAHGELDLLLRHGDDLAAAVLVPAHHGSRSSSTEAFLRGVSPGLTLVSAGYRNRFGHPAREVVERFAAFGIDMRRTDQEGALSVHLRQNAVAVDTERAARRRYWHGG
ncbi:MAG TPA: competence protein ComEC, partial [Rhodocyclaceae bacterium]|nr:competence protein ComEC [Rhodocyclaceae bacterium]